MKKILLPFKFYKRRDAKKHPMRNAVGICLICICTGCAAGTAVMNRSNGVETADLYCVDRDLYKLIPYRVELDSRSAQDSADQVIDKLIYGMKYEKIAHIIPEIKNGVTVDIRDNTAYVNFSAEMIEKHPSDIDSEYLTVYSIVNSLASIDGVDGVRFTMDGREQADFKGYLDMREMFVPNYDV